MGKLIDADVAIDTLNEQIEQCNKALGSFDISLKDEYAIKVERASLEAYKEQLENMPSIQPEQQWHPVTETPPRGDDLMLKVHDRRCHLDNFNYYVMGFHDGREFQTYLFRHQDDHDIEIVGWQLCPWKGEEDEAD